MILHYLNRPHCRKNAVPLSISTISSPLFGRPEKCQHCSEPIKFNFYYYPICFSIFIILLVLCEYYPIRFIRDFINLNTTSFYILFLGKIIVEILFYTTIIYISFELPAKYLGIKIFKKH